MFKKGEKAYLRGGNWTVTVDRYERNDGQLLVVTTEGRVFFEHELHPAHESVIEGQKDERQIHYDRMAANLSSKQRTYYDNDLRKALEAKVKKLPFDFNGHFRRGKDLGDNESIKDYIEREIDIYCINAEDGAALTAAVECGSPLDRWIKCGPSHLDCGHCDYKRNHLKWETNGVILDDYLLVLISKFKCKTTLLFDSCNSGTVCDLPYSLTYTRGRLIQDSTRRIARIPNPYIYMISGCKDNQESMDSYADGGYCGAFTNAFLKSIDPKKSIVDIYVDTCKKMSEAQTPVLSTSAPIIRQSAPTLSLNPSTSTVKRSLNFL
jgi:hypothetical protein